MRADQTHDGRFFISLFANKVETCIIKSNFLTSCGLMATLRAAKRQASRSCLVIGSMVSGGRADLNRPTGAL